MIISKNLLSSIVPEIKNLSFDLICETLIKVGVEIEASYTHTPIQHLVYGQILNCNPHPKSNKLQLCEVQLSDGQKAEIVCGAKNARANIKVIVAKIGAILPNGLEIKPREILGIVSCGMICSYQELSGISKLVLPHSSDDCEGILELDPDFNVFQPFDPSVIGLDDVVFDLSIPSNRADLNSAFGLALELVMQLKLDFKPLSQENLITKISALKKTDVISVVANSEIVNAVTFLQINNLEIKTSPWKVKRLLLNNNFSCINNLVDVGNLISHLFNQPVHFHDAQKVFKQIRIDFASNQVFTDLTQKKRQLDSKDVVIYDGSDQVIAMGGMIGSDKTAIDFQTKSAYLEIINFNHLYILKSNLKHQINTDSALKNSKVKANYLTLLATCFAIDFFEAQNILELITLIVKPQVLKCIVFDQQWISEFLGVNFDWQKIETQMKFGGFTFSKDQIQIPAWRTDLENINDISEEIVKLLDINTLPPLVPRFQIDFANKIQEFTLWKQTRQLFSDAGFNEAKTYNLQDEKTVKQFNFMQFQVSPNLFNPISQLRTTLRVHGLKELLSVIKYNLDKQNGLSPWFEIMNVQQENFTYQTLNLVTPIYEHQFALNQSGIKKDLYDLKRLIRLNLSYYHQKVEFLPTEVFNPELEQVFVPATLLQIMANNKLLGYLGQLNFEFLKTLKWDFKIPCLGCFYLLEVNPKRKIRIPKHFSEYPSSFKDFSFTVDKDFKLDLILSKIKEIKWISEVKIVEKYIIDNVKVNYLISVRISKPNATLIQVEIDEKITLINEIFQFYNILLR